MKKIIYALIGISLLILLQVAAESKSGPDARDVVEKVAPLPKNTEEQDIFISRCLVEMINENPATIKKEGISRCRYRQIKTKAITAQSKEIGEMIPEQFMELYLGKLFLSIDKCQTERCKEYFKKRIDKQDTIKEKYRTKIQIIEENKLKKIKEFNDLRKSGYFIKYDGPYDFKARDIDPIQLDIARKNFMNAEQNFIRSKESARITKQQFDKAKNEIEDCVVNSTTINTAECIEINSILTDKAKEHLLNTADRIIEHLNKLEAKVKSNDDLTEDEASEMAGIIEKQILIIQSEKAKIDGIKSKDEIIGAAKRMRFIWAEAKQATGFLIQKTVNARIGGIIVQLKQLSIKLERVITRITENNVDVSGIEPLVERFDEQVEEARINYQKAQEKFNEAKSDNLPNMNLIKEAQEYMQKAHQSLQESQEQLKEIVLSIKQAGGVKELEITNEEERIEEQLEGQV